MDNHYNHYFEKFAIFAILQALKKNLTKTYHDFNHGNCTLKVKIFFNSLFVYLLARLSRLIEPA